MVKRVKRLVSGQCEVARICGAEPEQTDGTTYVNSSMTDALWKEWISSRKLQPLFMERAKDPQMNVDDTATLICKTKRINESPVLSANLRRCLQEIKGVNQVIAAVKAMSTEPFDGKNAEHERKLEELWQLLLPGEEREGGRYSKDWGRIGFQQADPASDFRGGGMLGLNQLLFLASTRTPVARRMISEPPLEQSRYPWACVGINLTMEAVRILEARKIDASLYGKSMDVSLEVFYTLYADMFEILHARWVQAKPENLLAFPPVLKEVLASVDEEIAKNGSLVPPGTEA